MGATSLAGGRFRLERAAGHGGMASVYLGRDDELDRPVAIKLLAENLAGDRAFRERFLREARLAARLSHPNVVSVYDAGEDEGRPYIVMEYVHGETVADVLARRGPLPLEEAVDLALQACRGLEHAHAAGLVHRDVKPQNLLLRGDGTLKIADFGIARAAETTALTQVGTVLGTAAYLSPEQAAGEQVTAAADVYSLGAVLYELLTGRPPYEFGSLAEVALKQNAGDITPVAELAPDVPRALEDAVMRCLARNPSYRPGSAGELARELAPGTVEPAKVPMRPTLVRSTAVFARRTVLNRYVWLVLAGVLVFAAILLAVALASDDSSKTKPSAPPPVSSIPRGSTPRQQALNLKAWLRRYSAR